MNLIFSIFMSTVILFHSCASKSNRPSEFSKISNVAAITRLKSVRHFELVSSKNKQNDFCYIENIKLPYFINANKYENPLTFLKKSLPFYQNLTESDLAKMMSHRYLREIYCGEIYKNPTSKNSVFYFSIENEDLVSFKMLQEIYNSLRKRVNIAGSRLYFFYHNEDLYKEKHRAIKAKGLPIASTQNLNFLARDDKPAAVPSDSESIHILAAQTTHTKIELSTGITTLDESLYGHRSKLEYYSDEKRIFVPFAMNEYFLNNEIGTSHCDEAKTACSRKHGNSCQFPHGICLNATMKSRKPKLADALSEITESIQFNRDSNGSMESKIAFISELISTMKLDSRIYEEIKSKLQSEFKTHKFFNIYPSFNIAGLTQTTNHFLASTAVCIESSAMSCFRSYEDRISNLEQGIINSYKKIYSKESLMFLKAHKEKVSSLRVGLEFNRSLPNSQMVGYAYIHPDGQSRTFALKLINTETKKYGAKYLKPIYLNVSSENIINRTNEHSKTKRNDISISKDIMERVVLSVKNQYLFEVKENGADTKRLYTFKYEIDEEGEPILSSAP